MIVLSLAGIYYALHYSHAAPARPSITVYFFIAGTLLVPAIILSYLLARFIAHPLETILARVRRFPELSTRIFPDSGINEINELYLRVEEFMAKMKIQIRDLNLEKELLSTLLNSLNDGVLCLDTTGSIIFQNDRIDTDLVPPGSTGRQYIKSIKNSALLGIISGRIRQDGYAPMSIVDRVEEMNPEETLKHENEQIFSRMEFAHSGKFYEMVITPIMIENRLELYLIIIHDRTRERNIKRLREDFLQNASHELKTPITSIRGYSETLFSRTANERDRGFLNAILRNALRMERIIEDMVTVSSLESGAFPFNPEKIKMSEFIQDIVELVSGILKPRSQKLSYSVRNDVVLFADPLLIEHLLLNLISNASRYSPENTEIDIEIGQWPKGEAQYIKVCDQGPGIPEEFRDRIFERFFRADRNRSRIEGGTGLGLSIVRQITRIHGGTIRVESAKNGGACFSILIPG